MFVSGDAVEGDLRADLCIVGSGPAGLTIARELEATGARIIVIESGGFELDADTQNLYKAEQRGFETDSVQVNRLRVFGGTSGHWGGRCLRLEEIDFEARDWVADSGWPFGASDLESFYRRALTLLGIADGEQRSVEDFSPAKGGVNPLAGPVLKNFVVRISEPPMRFGVAFRNALDAASNIRVLLNSNVVEVECDENARFVRGVRVATLGGRSFRVRAPRVVLATGAIENARLLLNSNSVESAGLGNSRDLVGRYFMQHPHVLLSKVLCAGSFNDALGRDVSRTDAAIATCFTADVQRQNQILNGYFLMWDTRRIQIDGFIETSKEVFRQLRQIYAEDELARDLGYYLEAVEQLETDADSLSPGSGHTITTIAERPEQAPNRLSRVALSAERDALGMRGASVDWQLTDLDRHTFRRCRQLLAQELGRLGLGRLRDWPEGVDPTIEGGGYLHGGHHHMGTTRMHDDPSRGVVDRNGQVHGVANLYVAGGSVFPTSGFAYPTLTIIALSLRLADELAESLRRETGSD